MLDSFDDEVRGWVPAIPRAGCSYDRRGSALLVRTPRGLVVQPDRTAGVADVEALPSDVTVRWQRYEHDRVSPDVLRDNGFTPGQSAALMVAVVADLPAPDLGIEVTRVEDPSGFTALADLQSRVWGADLGGVVDELAARWAAEPEDTVVLLAHGGGEVVCGAWLTFRPGTSFAGLRGGATLPAWRGRGTYRALVAHRAAVARTRGVRFLDVAASDDSRPVLERLGFRRLSTLTTWTRVATESRNTDTPLSHGSRRDGA